MLDMSSRLRPTDDYRSFGSPNKRAEQTRDQDLQRAKGYGRIVLGSAKNGARIVDLVQRTPTRFMFPRVGKGAVEEIVFVNTAGGIAGGDCLQSTVIALSDVAIAVTSQAAEKIYMALTEPARIATTLKASKGAKLAWLPQETIVFNWGRLRRETEVDLSSGAELLALEWLVLGRSARCETVASGNISESWRVKKDGRLIWADSFRVTDETIPHLRRKALLADYKAIGTLIYFGPEPHARLELLRDIARSLINCNCAATAVGALIVVRFAAIESYDLKLALRIFLEKFGELFGPGPFRVPKMWVC